MTSELRQGWQRLRAGKPGERFQQRYRASRQHDRTRWWLRLARFAVAAVAVAIGIVLMFIPGPAVLFFAIAGTLLASESRVVARFLDWSEVQIRRVTSAALRAWRRWSWAGRVTALGILALLGAAAAFLAYRMVFG